MPPDPLALSTSAAHARGAGPGAAIAGDAADADGFEARLAAHRGIVGKVAASYAREPQDRADLAQEIALQLWRAWPGYSPERSFSTWMYRIALNVAITQGRRRGSAGRAGEPGQRVVEEPLDEAHHALVGAADVDAEARQQLQLVQAAMRSLGPLDRALLLMHLDGCSHRETGDVLGIAEGNVATRLNRIRQHLRRSTGAPPNGAHPDGARHGTR